MRLLLADMRQTLLVGNDVLMTAKSLTDSLKPTDGELQDEVSAAPVDIEDYHALLKEASTLVG